MKKEEETVGFMFKRTKELSALISDFHMTHIKKIDLNITQENILSFNSASQKLNEIFEEYKNLLKRLENEPGEVKSNYFLPLNNKEKEA